ncbi:MAG TPA: hypothetical protein PLI09_00565 [Candidatus Hydrogenedentes bacterium]|nr:hypothetical protein [Candidatus Hydrogenedentota bacterium]
MFYQCSITQASKFTLFAIVLSIGLPAGWAAPLSPPPSTQEAEALADVCSIVRAEELCKQFNYIYFGSFSEIQFLECDFSVPRNGYVFTLSANDGAYQIHANPSEGSGRYFYADPNGFRAAEGAPAGPDSTLFDNPCVPPLTCVDAAYETILANDISARQDMCRILEAEYAYYSAIGSFATSFGELTTADPPYLPNDGWDAARNGYVFTLGGTAAFFSVNADPESFNITGFRCFYIDAAGVMRYEIGYPAAAWSMPLDEGCMTDEAVSGDYEAIILERICAIMRAQNMYYESNFMFASVFDELTTPAMAGTPPCLEGDFSSVTLGYVFGLGGSCIQDYTIFCVPEIMTSTSPSFYADETGIIRKHIGAEAGPEDPPVDLPCSEHPFPASRMLQIIIDNENAARASLQQILDAEYAYHRDTGCFATAFDTLTNAVPPYLTGDWYTVRNGYTFVMGGTASNFSANADPETINLMGRKGYFVDATGILRYENGAMASDMSYPVPQGFIQGDMVALTDDLALEYACSLNMAEDLYFKRYHRYGTLDELSEPSSWWQPPFGCYYLWGLGFGYGSELEVAPDGLSYQFNSSPACFYANIHVYTDQIGVVHYNTGMGAGPTTPAVIEPCSENPIGFSRLRRVIEENEQAARDRMCEVFSAEQRYFTDHGAFAVSLDDLLTAIPPYLEPITPEPCGRGYKYMLISDGTAFQLNADPTTMAKTGIKAFFVDETGVVRVVENGVADVTSPEEGTVCSVEGEEGEGEIEPGLCSADTNQDHRIDLGEVLRVVQFYNSGGYQCLQKRWRTEDGYEPGPGAAHACTPHSTDYNPQDWAISLEELLRLFQFYNSGGYHYCPMDGTEDSFCPGP